ncbi:MAG: NFACT family protein, partial [Longimicrobiales bacterium]|nr:NFACT family protein [Longimicrobiales bacterium]
MSILWDAPLTAAVARELRDELIGSRLRAVRMDRDSRDLVLHFRERTLVFRLHPLHGDVALLDPREPGPGSIALKAHVREIQAPPDERLLMLQMQPPTGGASPEGIVVELMTNQWNAIWLTVGNERIRRVLWQRELEDRTLAAGEIYRPPSPSDRRGIDEPLTEDEWLELLETVEPRKRRGALLRSVAFTSSVNASFLLGGADPGGRFQDGSRGSDSTADGATDVESSAESVSRDTEVLLRGYRLWRRIRAVSLELEPAEPQVLETEKRREPYPLALPTVASESAASLLDAFQQAAGEGPEDASARAALLPSTRLDRLAQAVERARTKVDRLREELAETP